MELDLVEDDPESEEDVPRFSKCLIGSGMSLDTMLPGSAAITAVFSGLSFLFVGVWVFDVGHSVLLPLYQVLRVLFVSGVIMTVIGSFTGWVYRFQILSSILTTFFTFTGTVCGPSLLMLYFVSIEFDGLGYVEYPLTRIVVAGIVGMLCLVGCSLVQASWIRVRLNDDRPTWKTETYHPFGRRLFESRIFRIALPIVVIAANVPTLGRHALMTIAILGFLFFAWVMPNLTLEAGYLTYLKIRDRRYWEEKPRTAVKTREQRIEQLQKVGKGIVKCLLIILACFAGLYGVMELIDLMVLWWG